MKLVSLLPKYKKFIGKIIFFEICSSLLIALAIEFLQKLYYCGQNQDCKLWGQFWYGLICNIVIFLLIDTGFYFWLKSKRKVSYLIYFFLVVIILIVNIFLFKRYYIKTSNGILVMVQPNQYISQRIDKLMILRYIDYRFTRIATPGCVQEGNAYLVFDNDRKFRIADFGINGLKEIPLEIEKRGGQVSTIRDYRCEDWQLR